jgi:hypothetical protein
MHACTTHASHPQAGGWPPIPPLSFLDHPYPVISDAPLDLGSEHGPFPFIRIPMQWLHGERAFFRARRPPMTIPTHQLCQACCLGMIATATFRFFGLFWVVNLSTT